MNELSTITTIQIDIPEQQASAWISLAKQKNEVAAELTRRELACQQILIPEPVTYQEIDTVLASYRKAVTELADYRKAFTNKITGALITPFMEPEKRLSEKTNERYIELSNRSSSLRKEEERKAAEINAKNQESASFKAFIQNEYTRIAAEYRAELRKSINVMYASWLNDNVQQPDTATLINLLSKIEIPKIGKFNPKYLSREEMIEIFNKEPKPDYARILADAQGSVQEVFANYQSDLQNREAAIAHQKQQEELRKKEEEERLAQQQAVNTLIATAEAVQIETPKIKRTVEIVVVESETWAKAVMAAFIVNLPNLHRYIRVKSWSKLSIGQMADALSKHATETGECFNGMELKEVEK